MAKTTSKTHGESEDAVLSFKPKTDSPAEAAIIEVPPVGKYINPLTDFGFKRLFGERNKELMIDFLNAVLDLKHKIVSITYRNVEHTGKVKDDRSAFFDLHCVTGANEYIIIEMQHVPQSHFMDRVLYYVTFPIQKQAKKGKWNYKLNPVYAVCLLDFVFGRKNGGQYIHYVQLMDRESKSVFYKKLLFVFFELPDFTKDETALVTDADKWLYVIKHLYRMRDMPEKLKKSKVFRRLFEEAKIANLTPEELEIYKLSHKEYWNMYTVRDIMRDYEKDNATLSHRLATLTNRNAALSGTNAALSGKVTALSNEIIALRRLLQQEGKDVPN
jgi:predicted transposase/invertase (TIGR01784 family)